MSPFRNNKYTLAYLLTASLISHPLLASAFPETFSHDAQLVPSASPYKAPKTYEGWQKYLTKPAHELASSYLHLDDFDEGRILFARLNKSQEWFEQTRALATRAAQKSPYLAFNAWQSVYMCANTLWPGALSRSRNAAIELVVTDDQMLRSVCESFAHGLDGYNRFSGLVRVAHLREGVEMSTAGLFQTFMKAYAKRTLQDGIYALDDAVFMASLLLLTHKTPLAWMTTRTTNWDIELLQVIADKTPTLLPHDKALLKSHVALLEDDIRLSYGKLQQGRGFYEKIIRDLKPFETQESGYTRLFHPADYYAHVAKAHFALRQGPECVKAWHLFHTMQEPGAHIGARILEEALRHLSVYCKSPQIHAKYWHSFVTESRLRIDNFQPTFFELEVLALPTAPSQWVELNHEYVSYLEALVAFFKADGAALNTPDFAAKFDHAYHSSVLRLANIYISQSNYEKATELYKHYFEIKENTVHMNRNMRRICDTHRVPIKTQTTHLQDAAVSFVQTGLLTLSPDAASRLSSALTTPSVRGKAKAKPASRAAQSNSTTHPATHVRAHLIAHYTNRVDEMVDSLDAMIKKLQKTDNARIAHKAGTLLGLLKALKTKIVAQPASPIEAASSPENLPQIGRQIDTLTQSFGAIMADYTTTLKAHKEQARKDHAAHLGTLKADERTLAPFDLPKKSAVTPSPAKTKVKTRGKTNTRFAAPSAPASSSSDPALSSPRSPLFFTAQAQNDYNALSPELQEKFHSFAHEIATNPYGILGTLGRTERLSGLDGTYFSRRLTKGDRVVYEVVKSPDGPARVIFMGLLGHYKTLSRQAGAQTLTPYGEALPSSSTSSSSSSLEE